MLNNNSTYNKQLGCTVFIKLIIIAIYENSCQNADAHLHVCAWKIDE